MKTQTVEEYQADLKSQGVPIEHCAMRCPMCGTIQSAHDLISVGAGKTLDEVEKYLGFSCLGRWTHHKPPPMKKGTQHGCNWTLGGLFQTHELTVITPDGTKHARFQLCTAEEAQSHMNNNKPTERTQHATQ
jgi:hypothetical protein